MKVTHIIASLELGGANMMLYKLLAGAQNPQIESSVIVLMDKGKLGEPIEALGVPVHEIGIPRGRLSLSGLMKLRKTIVNINPDLIQAWAYHSNMAASLLGFAQPHIPVLWNIRHTPYELNNYKKLTSLIIRYGKWLSCQPAAIIYNSQVSAERHQKLGYRSKHVAIIPNGFDVQEFQPSPTSYSNLRSSLGLPESTLLIGMAARYHPMKDHAGFLKAACELAKQNSQVHFVLVGRGVDGSNQELTALIAHLNLDGRVHLMGECKNMAEITAGFDIATLTSSWGDAFPNVVGEAMACGVPCVVTDVGDSAYIVGDTGVVVPPRDAEALCRGWKQLLDMDPGERRHLGQRARQRIVENFSLEKIVAQYEALYFEEFDKAGV